MSIEVKGLSKRYGRREAVRGLSFEVPRHAVVGFLGPNGAGKSTTLRMLAGVLPATQGEAWVCGYSLARQGHQVRRRVGYMPEHNPLPGGLQVEEYLLYRARLKGTSDPKAATQEVLEACQIEPLVARQRIETLSKGYRQRVGLADALLGKPELLILDEPTSGLDPLQVQGVRQLLKALEGHTTIVLSTHILSEVERMCNHILVLNQGSIIAQGSYPQMLNKHENLESLFLEALQKHKPAHNR